MSLFEDIDWDQGSDNPFGLDTGIYEVSISDAAFERSEKNNLGLWLTFSAENGKSIRKWITMPEKSQDAETYSRNTSFLRLTLKQLEIPEEDWDETLRNPDRFIGLDCVIVVNPQKKNPEYNQISKLSRAKGTPTQGTSTGDGFGAFSKPEVPSDGGFKF